MIDIVIASTNSGKINEISQILAPLGYNCISRDEAGIPPFEIEESGDTFEANSLIKARAIAEHTEQIVIADDSGLCVDALDGAPGVMSARFAGDGASSMECNDLLLSKLREVPDFKRTAHFVAVITMLYPDGHYIVARGEVRGLILREPEGLSGFGYDPLFVPDGYKHSFSVLGHEIKNSISHRAAALMKLKQILLQEA